jgi:hypothetical protein
MQRKAAGEAKKKRRGVPRRFVHPVPKLYWVAAQWRRCFLPATRRVSRPGEGVCGAIRLRLPRDQNFTMPESRNPTSARLAFGLAHSSQNVVPSVSELAALPALNQTCA